MPNELEEIKNRIDLVELISLYIPVKKSGRNHKALCPFHNEKTASLMISPEKQIWHCFGCFPKGEQIKTLNGLHSIEKIKPGDKVLTHRGEYQRVIRTLWRPYKGYLVDVKPRKINQIVSLTEDHKVFVIQTKNCRQKERLTRLCQRKCKQNCPTKYFLGYKIKKIAAKDLQINDYLLYPINQKTVDPKNINLENYLNRSKTNFGPKIKRINYVVPINTDLLKLLGYWIAEGSNHRAYIRFSLGNHEMQFAKEIKEIASRLFDLKASIHKRSAEHSGIEVTICNSNLANIFQNLCGKGANNKHIPYELNYLIPTKQKIILEAIFKGDGHKGKVAKTKDRYYKSITTISPLLADQLKDIILRQKLMPTVNIKKAKIDQKGISHKESFTVYWQEDLKGYYSDFYEYKDILYWLLPIKEIRKRKFTGNVYNLTISKDHSYVANYFSVGNCSEGGDHFGWVMKMEGVDFGQALKILADKAGVRLQKDSLRRVSEQSQEKEKLYNLNQIASNFYHFLLTKHDIGKLALEYLHKREITNKNIKDFQIGYAPDKKQALISFFEKKNIAPIDLLQAGLVIKSEFSGNTKSKYIDKFRGRIIVPIWDIAENTVAFTGRLLADKKDAPKYLNSPDTVVFNKSLVLYGLNKARKAIRQKNRVILVEGNMDVITLHAHGYPETVASSGTAVTAKQFESLANHSDNILLAFDSDDAGVAASKKASEIALSLGIEVKFILIPDAKDPDELIRKNRIAWDKNLSEPKNLIEFILFHSKKDIKDMTTQDKRKITGEILPIIRNLDDAVLRSEYLNKLATALKIDIKYLEEALQKTKTKKDQYKSQNTKSEDSSDKDSSYKQEIVSNREILERKIIGILLLFFSELIKIQEDLNYELFSDNLSSQTLKGIRKYFAKYKKFELDKFLSKLPDKFKKKLDFIILSTEGEFANVEEDEIIAEFILLLNKLKSFSKEKITSVFAQKIKQAEANKDITTVKKLLNDLQKKLKE
ncbi:MAG: DNA primase [bacterium]